MWLKWVICYDCTFYRCLSFSVVDSLSHLYKQFYFDFCYVFFLCFFSSLVRFLYWFWVYLSNLFCFFYKSCYYFFKQYSFPYSSKLSLFFHSTLFYLIFWYFILLLFSIYRIYIEICSIVIVYVFWENISR